MAVHPRGRGERNLVGQAHAEKRGSSPRARGTRKRSISVLRSFRFIPAGAGNAAKAATPAPGVPVHPRGRGERLLSLIVNNQRAGSSPRARGTRVRKTTGANTLRFIPAGAGNAFVCPPGRLWITVHPRGRGERQQPLRRGSFSHGSSPRARGTPKTTSHPEYSQRFIPAGAGNAPVGNRWHRRRAVHPRGRGERCALPHRSPGCSGSSPRARGTHEEDSRTAPSWRFIPAGAGNARTARRRTGKPAVHPRGRGERGRPVLAGHRSDGSSPRARGTQECL